MVKRKAPRKQPQSVKKQTTDSKLAHMTEQWQRLYQLFQEKVK